MSCSSKNRVAAVLTLTAAGFLAAPSVVLAQDTQPATTTTAAKADVPSAETIIENYVKALGGEKAIRSIKSRKLSGRFIMPGMEGMPGMEDGMAITMLSAEPNKMLMIIDSGDFGTVKQGYDGKIAWMMNPQTGPMILEDEMYTQMADQAEFNPELNYSKRFKDMKSTGRQKFGERDCYVVEMTTQSDSKQTEYFDVETNLLAGTIMVQDNPMMGEMEVVSRQKDYKEVNGVKVPMTIEIEVMQMVQALKFDSVEFNNVDKNAFELPAEIKALVKDVKEEEIGEHEENGEEGKHEGDDDGGM